MMLTRPTTGLADIEGDESWMTCGTQTEEAPAKNTPRVRCRRLRYPRARLRWHSAMLGSKEKGKLIEVDLREVNRNGTTPKNNDIKG